ncbi:MAG: hypothetical protein VX794_01775 [Nitrospinota bacterium]|nr:hypothetical protein [Nitrospinota bacterium]
MDKEIKFNYEDLLADYVNNIDNKLRGFRQSFDMLDMWVPDEDHEKSILNLIESVQISGKEEFKIFLSKEIVQKIDLMALKKTLSSFANLKTISFDNGIEIQISGSLQ